MILPPSKKIFVGASAMVSGIVFQFVLGWLYGLSEKALESGRVAATADAAEIERKLELLRSQMSLGLNGITASWVFMVLGILLLITGVYQNARAVERLQSRLELLNAAGVLPPGNSDAGA